MRAITIIEGGPVTIIEGRAVAAEWSRVRAALAGLSEGDVVVGCADVFVDGEVVGVEDVA